MLAQVKHKVSGLELIIYYVAILVLKARIVTHQLFLDHHHWDEKGCIASESFKFINKISTVLILRSDITETAYLD